MLAECTCGRLRCGVVGVPPQPSIWPAPSLVIGDEGRAVRVGFSWALCLLPTVCGAGPALGAQGDAELDGVFFARYPLVPSPFSWWCDHQAAGRDSGSLVAPFMHVTI